MVRVLERATPDLVRRFLDRWSNDLAAADLEQLPEAYTPQQARRFYRQLCSAPHPVGEALVALRDVATLSTTAGARALELLLSERPEAGLGSRVESLSPWDLALRTFMEQPAIFTTARAQVSSQERKRFVEFYPNSPRPIAYERVTAILPAVEEDLAHWFASHNRTAACWLEAVELEHQVVVFVVHGRPRQSVTTITSAGDRGRSSFIPDKEDLIVLCKRTGSLGVNAQFPNEIREYQRLWGRHLFGDDQHFGVTSIYTGAPLAEKGVRALAPTGVPGLRHVALKELVLTCPQDGTRLHWSSCRGNLGMSLARPPFQALWGVCEVQYMKLLFRTDEREFGFVVEVRPPNKLTCDRQFEPMVREFLERRGFASYPNLQARSR